MKKKIIIICLTILLVLGGIFIGIKMKNNKKTNQDDEVTIEPSISKGDFDYNLIHLVNKNTKNYLISPYSIGYALSMLKDGAKDETLTQLNELLGNTKYDKFENVEDRIGIANAIFIKNIYKDDISSNYLNTLKNKYDSEIIFNELLNADPINNWVKNKTYNMIDKVIETIDKDFVLGLVNAIAIDVEWKTKFEEENTYDGTWNNDKKVSMMHSSNSVTYIENNKAKGIIKDYKKYGDTELEFIAILPNDNLQEYINNFNKEELDSILSNKKVPDSNLDIKLTIPKFSYDYQYEKLKDDLISIGVVDVFDGTKSNLRNMLTDDSILQLYASDVIHKTHIELSESGTKAAAVTFIPIFKNTAMPQEKEVINIVFDRPFLYIIKDKNSDNIWFFGTVYNPEN